MTTEIDAEGLAVCPFCGNAPVIRRTMQDYPADGVHPAGQYEAAVHVCCDTCGFELLEEYQSDAIAAWNHRATTRTSEAEPVAVRPLDTAPSGDDAMEPSEVDVYEGAWALVIGTNGKAAGWIDTHALFAHQLYCDQILPLPTPASDDQVEAVCEALKDGRKYAELWDAEFDSDAARQAISDIDALLAAMGSTKP